VLQGACYTTQGSFQQCFVFRAENRMLGGALVAASDWLARHPSWRCSRAHRSSRLLVFRAENAGAVRLMESTGFRHNNTVFRHLEPRACSVPFLQNDSVFRAEKQQCFLLRDWQTRSWPSLFSALPRLEWFKKHKWP